MWDPAQRSRFIELAGIGVAPRRTLQRVRSALLKVNRLMTVVTSALFARRMEQDHIDRVTEQRARDQDQRPAPIPKEIERGFIIKEYERISRLGKKTRPDREAAPATVRASSLFDDLERAASSNDEDLDQHRDEQERPPDGGDSELDEEPQGLPGIAHTANSASVVGSYGSLPDNLASDTT